MDKFYRDKERVTPIRIILPVVVLVAVLVIMFVYTYNQRQNVIRGGEYVTAQLAKETSKSISSEIKFAKSGIRLAAINISQAMTSPELEDPAEVIEPVIDNTPFQSIEYIRADGMNVMNPGEPFDASERVYFKEGIKGNSGVWNNYSPRVSKETLINFYTPLEYDGEIVGVITGYIAADTNLKQFFENNMYGYEVEAIMLDENDMVICSTDDGDFVPDLDLDTFLGRFNIKQEQEDEMIDILTRCSGKVETYTDSNGEGRVCVKRIPGTTWRVAVIVPSESFDGFVKENTSDTIIVIAIITLIVLAYASYAVLANSKRRRAIVIENAKVKQENEHIQSEMEEKNDIISSANMGIWHIDLVEGEEPRMYADGTMRMLLGISSEDESPEQIYKDWFDRIKPEAVQSVLDSVERMQMGAFDENTYLWIHPTKGERYVRCGGTAIEIPGGHCLRGYHYDVDDVVRAEQDNMEMLMTALEEKNDYYSTLGAIADTYYSMHVINLEDDTVEVYRASNNVRDLVNKNTEASEMILKVLSTNTTEEYKATALEFGDLSTVADRLKDKKSISVQLIGVHTGWYEVGFTAMERDHSGRPKRVICTTKVIDDEKRQEELLIRRSQTDELTGVFNRRAYEEDIYEHNDTPAEDFTFLFLDANGLKTVNDTMGHAAGDEVITGVCDCMKLCMGAHGSIYRIGGDEFVAILLCNEAKVEEILTDFDKTVENWKGKLIDSISVSYGFVSAKSMPGTTVRVLGEIAEQRMYKMKAAYYKGKGIDRRK